MKKRLGPKPLIFPMPALLVGTYDADGIPNAMTAAWTAVCCKVPLCVGVAIRKSRHTYANLQECNAFTLAVPSAKMATKVDYLGIVSGAKNADKLDIAEMRTEKADRIDAPILVDCPVNLECKLIEVLPLGTHDWCVGEVVEVQVDGELVDDTGALDIEKMDPLVYATGESEYRRIGPIVGKAFCDGKKLMNER